MIAEEKEIHRPGVGLCEVCEWDHEAGMPHNLETQFYRIQFWARFGRGPTWADACAHCGPQMRAMWKKWLSGFGVWSEPAEHQAVNAQEMRRA